MPPVSTDRDDLAAASRDRSGASADGPPLALVRAIKVGDVRDVLRLADSCGVTIVPRGAGTGLAGGALAGSGTIVLDLSGLNGVVEIDPVEELAVVQPGVITADLDCEARRYGLRYAPDPASAEHSTPPEAVRAAGDDIFALALELGGTVTGEHGIGTLKRDWLAREAGPDVIAVHADLKRALDPNATLNPGKVTARFATAMP